MGFVSKFQNEKITCGACRVLRVSRSFPCDSCCLASEFWKCSNCSEPNKINNLHCHNCSTVWSEAKLCEICGNVFEASAFADHTFAHTFDDYEPIVDSDVDGSADSGSGWGFGAPGDSDVVVPCDQCGKDIPFSRYAEHAQSHSERRGAHPAFLDWKKPVDLHKSSRIIYVDDSDGSIDSDDPIDVVEHSKASGDLDSDIVVPCDKCGREIPFSLYTLHIRGHSKRYGSLEEEPVKIVDSDVPMVQDPAPSSIEKVKPEKIEIVAIDENSPPSAIPCDRCGQSVPFDQFEEHSRTHERSRMDEELKDEWIPCDICDGHFAISEYADHFNAHKEKKQHEAELAAGNVCCGFVERFCSVYSL